ncbi:hypothetical protein AXF42_Ash009966 [Apostasia shenzhenica]|uniref:Uncharacterized protein n=1 Tax=Apostasia shenzhenica TaxID=1088818 RepID=A0A2I0ACI8_9ASPA|nr:hypothetical protein AXF42_Ash009966 [Apostasia shenzhenica]
MEEPSGLTSLDVDEWDENFITEVLQVELGVISSKNAVAKLPVPPPDDPPVPQALPCSSFRLEQEASQWRGPTSLVSQECGGFPSVWADADDTDISFSPPRELSQRFLEKSNHGLTANDCVSVDTRVLTDWRVCRNNDGGRKRKEAEWLKEKEVTTLKKDSDKKTEQLKRANFQIEAKDAEIHLLRRKNLGVLKQDQPKYSMSHVEAYNSEVKDFQPDGSAASELKRRIMIDNGATNSYRAQESTFPDRSTKTKLSRARGIQTDIVQEDSNIMLQKRMLRDQRISSSLHTIWHSPYHKRSGTNLIWNLLRSSSTDFYALFGSINMSSKIAPDKLTNESLSNMPFQDGTHPIQSSDSVKAHKFYHLLMKMRDGMVPLQAFFDPLLELCNLDNVSIACMSLRILRDTLQHLLLQASSRGRSNVFVGPSTSNNFKGQGTNIEIKELGFSFGLVNLCMEEDKDSSNKMSLSIEGLLNTFEVMQQIVARNIDDHILFEALSIMSLIVMESKPNSERERFCSINLLKTLSLIMRRDVGVPVRKQAVYLLFLLLNSPKMLEMLCGEQGAVHAEITDGQKSIAAPQAASYSIFEVVAEFLTCDETTVQELKLRRRIIIFLAFMASCGRTGFEVLLKSFTSQEINFIEMIIKVLAFEMDAEVHDSGAQQELCKERISLIREALILLNRLASHPAYSEETLRVLTGRKATARLTIDVVNRLLRRIHVYLNHCGMKKLKIATEIADLVRLLKLRVFGFLGSELVLK